MPRRPNRPPPRWGYGSGAAIVQPPSSKSGLGFVAHEEPPASWINYQLHYLAAWTDHARGPHLGNWQRGDHGAGFGALDDVWGVAVDSVTPDTAAPRRRWALVGNASGTPELRVSRRGVAESWVARSLPSMSGDVRGVAFVGARWLVWGEDTGELWSTPADDGTASSAIGADDAGYWSAVTLTDLRARSTAWDGVDTAVVAASSGVESTTTLRVSTDGGATWPGTLTYTWPGPSPYTTSLAYDATRNRFVVASGYGGLAGSVVGDPTSPWVTLGSANIGSGYNAQVRAGGGTYLMFAATLVNFTTPVTPVLARSTDGGATWSDLSSDLPYEPGSSDPVVMTDLVYADGVWVLSTANAPYLYESHDDGDSWHPVALPIGEEADWSLLSLAYGDGQVFATGADWAVTSGRAVATVDGSVVPDPTPDPLADAYALRGRVLTDNAPTDGQVLTWNASTSKFVFSTPSAGVSLSSATPAALGVAAAGSGTDASRDDHVHAMPSAADVGAVPATATAFLPVCLYATTDLASLTACGRCRVDPADLARSGLTTALTLDVIGDVSAGGLTGTVELYDLTAAATVATLTWTETSPTRKTASVTLPGAAHLYELRFSVAGGSSAADYLTIGGAQLRVTWS